MSLITPANLLAQADYLGGIYDSLLNTLGTSANQSSPIVGTIQNQANEMLAFDVALADYSQMAFLNTPSYNILSGLCVEQSISNLTQGVQALTKLCNGLGSSVSLSIKDIPSFLAYYNVTPYTYLLTPSFAILYSLLQQGTLPPAAILQPAITAVTPIVTNPTATVNANGIAEFTIGGSLAAGATPNPLYAPPLPLLVVATTLSGGSTGAVVTATGHDSGLLPAATWVYNVPQNQAAAISTTLSGSVPAQARSTVAVAAATGIVAGSILTIDAGLSTQETIVVEVLSGSNITAVFNRAHASSAAVTGFYTIAPASITGAARMETCTNLAFTTLSGHSAGAVRLVGRQDRVNL